MGADAQNLLTSRCFTTRPALLYVARPWFWCCANFRVYRAVVCSAYERLEPIFNVI